MADDLRPEDPDEGGPELHAALKRECAEQASNTVYTSTSFYIWARFLTWFRGVLWSVSIAAGAFAARQALAEEAGLSPLWTAAAAILAFAAPGAVEALKLEDAIRAYRDGAAKFKQVEGRLRRAAQVWSHKPLKEFETEAREALSLLEAAQALSLTPPETCFKMARRKIERGHYKPDPVKG